MLILLEPIGHRVCGSHGPNLISTMPKLISFSCGTNAIRWTQLVLPKLCTCAAHCCPWSLKVFATPFSIVPDVPLLEILVCWLSGQSATWAYLEWKPVGCHIVAIHWVRNDSQLSVCSVLSLTIASLKKMLPNQLQTADLGVEFTLFSHCPSGICCSDSAPGQIRSACQEALCLGSFSESPSNVLSYLAADGILVPVQLRLLLAQWCWSISHCDTIPLFSLLSCVCQSPGTPLLLLCLLFPGMCSLCFTLAVSHSL